MAGSEVLMSPVSMLMIHNPATIAWGDSEEMRKAKEMLDEVKESIINAYQKKTGLSRVKLSHMMSDETWMNANKSVELGFADKIMFAENAAVTDAEPEVIVNTAGIGMLFSRAAVTNSLIGKMPKPAEPQEPDIPEGTPVDSLYHRLNLITH
jgi:ATP-dependent Clp protease protease subunit